jgi:hypothetical protein
MKKVCFPLILILVAALPLFAGEIRTDRQEVSAENVRLVFADVPVGEVRVHGVKGSMVEAELRVSCSSSKKKTIEKAEEVRLEIRESGGRLSLEVEGYPKFDTDGIEVELSLKVPANLEFRIDMGVGEIEIKDMKGDMEIDLGVGEVDLEMPFAGVRSARLEVGVGEADLSIPSGHVEGDGWLGQDVRWDGGPGDSRIAIEVGVGEIDVDLR